MADDIRINKLAEEQSKKLIVDRWENYIRNTNRLRAKLIERYKQYRGISVRKSYDGLANVFINETLQACESIIAQIFNTIFSEVKYFYLKGREETDKVEAQITENLEMSVLEEMSFKSKILSLVRQYVIYGTCFARIYWKVTEKKLFSRQPAGSNGFDVQEQKKYIYDNPNIEVIDLLDVALSIEKSRIEDMKWVIVRKKVDYDYIVEKQKNKVYRNDIKIDKKFGGGTAKQIEINSKGLKINSSGINYDLLDTGSDCEILEMWGKIPRWWIDEDIKVESEESEELVDGVIEVLNNNIVLRLQRNPFYHQELPFVLAQFIKIDDEAFGIGVVEICESLQSELNDKRNQLLDYASLTILPPLIKQRGANIKNESIKLKPHHIISSDLPGDIAISPLRIGGNPAEIIQMESIIKSDIRNETGANNPQQGIKSGGDSTAYEISVLSQRALSRINIYVSEFGENILKRCYKLIYLLLYQYMDVKRAIKVVGKDGIKWHRRSAEDLLMDMDFVPKISTDSDSRVIVRNQLIQFLTAISKYYPQVNAYLLIRNIYQLFGNDDVDEVVPKPETERGQGELKNEEEIMVLSLGQKIDAKYYEDHTLKIDYALNWLRGNQNDLSEQAREAFEDYIFQHTQYLKVLETAKSAIMSSQREGQTIQRKPNNPVSPEQIKKQASQLFQN